MVQPPLTFRTPKTEPASTPWLHAFGASSRWAPPWTGTGMSVEVIHKRPPSATAFRSNAFARSAGARSARSIHRAPARTTISEPGKAGEKANCYEWFVSFGARAREGGKRGENGPIRGKRGQNEDDPTLSLLGFDMGVFV